MKKILAGKALIYLLAVALFLTNFAQTISAQDGGGGSDGGRRFKVGDPVEVFSAGEAKHGVIVGGYENTDYGYGTYQVHLEGEKYCNNHALDTRYNEKFVQPRFQTDAGARFEVGAAVEARRYDGSIHKGRVLAVGEGGGKYRIRYDGKSETWDEWVETNNLRAAGGNVATAPQNDPDQTTNGAESSTSGQKIVAAGDSVMYRGAGVTWSPGAKIERYDAEKRRYWLRFDSGSGDVVACHSVYKPGTPVNNDFFIGKWAVFVRGATSTFVQGGGGDLYRRYSTGVAQPPLEIKSDGTYVWLTDKGTIRGRWTARPDKVPGIVLLKGLDGLDYTIYENTESNPATKDTRDEIGLHHIPTSTGYYMAYRIGANKSCVLTGRSFGK